MASEGTAKRVQIPAWLQQEIETMQPSTGESADVRAKWVKPVDELKPDPHLDKEFAKAKIVAQKHKNVLDESGKGMLRENKSVQTTMRLN